jgi:hypothetical protein
MMPALVAIWRQPIVERRARGSLALSWVLLALCAAGALVLNSASAHRHALFAVVTGIPMAMLLVMWWVYLCSSVLVQCHPAALQLVPQLRTRARTALALAWLAIVAIMTLLAGIPSGYAPQVALVTALVLFETSYIGTARGLLLGVALIVLSNPGPGIKQWLSAIIAAPAALPVAAVLVLLDGVFALRRFECALGTAPAILPALARRPRSPGASRAAWFARGPDAQPAFLRPLGRSWFSLQLAPVTAAVPLCACMRFWSEFKGHDVHAALAGGRLLLGVAVFVVLAGQVYMESQRFSSARTEQALLMLTPAAPGRAALNRLLARLLLRGFLRAWLILWGLAMVTQALLGAQLPELARLSAVWAAALPLLAVPMRDFASARPLHGVPAAVLVAFLVVAGMVAVDGNGGAGRWVVIAAAGISLGLGAACWRWQVMLAAPPALPAGRM